MRDAPEEPIVEVSGLKVGAETALILDDIHLSVRSGEVVGLVGESGSGKTTLGLATLGHFRHGLYPLSGRIRVGSQQVLDLQPVALRQYREKTTAYIPQNPGTALNPALRVGTLIAEALPSQWRGDRSRILSLLDTVDLPARESFLRLYPHQLSGGQQQRIAIAAAFARHPKFILLDEPTTALDVTTQSQILETVQRLCREHKVAALYVSHDLAVVAALAHRVAVMRNGRIVEVGQTSVLFHSPSVRYTQALIAAIPDPARPMVKGNVDDRALESRDVDQGLTVESLKAAFGARVVVHDVSLQLPPRICVALVGQSGSGKTTLARSLVGLHQASAGTLSYRGRPLSLDLRARTPTERQKIQYIFQNSFAAFNPRRSIGGSIAAALSQFEQLPQRTLRKRVADVLDQVALPADAAHRLPSQLSGGQRQRASIARALILEPDVLICDEITSALDVTVQATIIALLQQLQHDRSLALLFVTHNLALARQFAQRAIVMHQGKVVEEDAIEGIFTNPKADETQRLLHNLPHLPVIAPDNAERYDRDVITVS